VFGEGSLLGRFSLSALPQLRSALDTFRLTIHRALGARRVELESNERALGALLARIDILEEEVFKPQSIEIADFSDPKKTHSHLYTPRKTVAICGGWFDFRTGVTGIEEFALTQSKTNIPRAGLVLPYPVLTKRHCSDLAICVGDLPPVFGPNDLTP